MSAKITPNITFKLVSFTSKPKQEGDIGIRIGIYKKMVLRLFETVGACPNICGVLDVNARILAETQLNFRQYQIAPAPKSANGVEIKLRPGDVESSRKVILSFPITVDIQSVIDELIRGVAVLEQKSPKCKKLLGEEIRKGLRPEDNSITPETFATQIPGTTMQDLILKILDVCDREGRVYYPALTAVLNGEYKNFLSKVIGSYDVCTRDGVEIGIKFNLNLLQALFEDKSIPYKMSILVNWPDDHQKVIANKIYALLQKILAACDEAQADYITKPDLLEMIRTCFNCSINKAAKHLSRIKEYCQSNHGTKGSDKVVGYTFDLNKIRSEALGTRQESDAQTEAEVAEVIVTTETAASNSTVPVTADAIIADLQHLAEYEQNIELLTEFDKEIVEREQALKDLAVNIKKLQDARKEHASKQALIKFSMPVTELVKLRPYFLKRE